MAQSVKSGRNPAIGFLIMAGFNVAAAVSFIVFYFLYQGANGQQSYLLLLASLISLLAAAGLILAYGVFRKRLQATNRNG